MAGTQPRLLDLFCGAGGATRGYQDAGFYVVGVDHVAQPNYCGDEFIKGDALEVLSWRDPTTDWWKFDAIHASPPCQDHSRLSSVAGKHGTGWLLEATLNRLRAIGAPWVVENVEGADMPKQSDFFGRHGLMLCGTMFGLKVLRHRMFELSFPPGPTPPHGSHVGEFYSPAGHGDPNWKRRDENPHLSGPGYADRCRDAMGIDWMNRDELAQAIPPAYTEWIGRQLLQQIEVAA